MKLASWKGCKWWLSFRVCPKKSQPGVAISTWCKKLLHYGSSGKEHLKLHAIQNKENYSNYKDFF